MNYVTYDADGNLTGSYLQDLQPEHADCYIEVTDDQRMNSELYRANAARDGLELIPVTGPTPEQIKAAHNAPILAALLQLDMKAIRPLRDGEADRVADLAAQAAALRATLIA